MKVSTWHVPFPDSETEYDGKNIYWKYRNTVNEEGIEIYAEQYLVFRETNHYVWIVPASWIQSYAFNPERWYREWQKGERHGIRKIAKNAERSFAHPSRELALASLLRKKKYHLMRLKQDLAVISTVVKEVGKIDPKKVELLHNFGHNSETENWVFD